MSPIVADKAILTASGQKVDNLVKFKESKSPLFVCIKL